MKRRPQPWTPAELDMLRKHWPAEGMKCAHLFPRHTLSAVTVRARMLGLEFAGKRKYPSPYEDKPAKHAGGTGIITPRPYLLRVAFGELERK